MEKSTILNADLLDILFDGKNKSYGAYELRKTYEKRISYALGVTVLICLLFVAGSILASSKKIVSVNLPVITVELENLKNTEKKTDAPKPLPKPELKAETVKNFVPKISPDETVSDEDAVKDIDILAETKIGDLNQHGVNEGDLVEPPVEKGPGVAEAPRKKDDIDDGTFETVQIPAEFIGGLDGWKKFLERNLNRDLPSQNGAPTGSYTVTVSFIVDKSGAISDVKAENDPGYGTSEEAVRVIRKGPSWNPAIQNGRKVVYRHRQNITFKVSGD